MAFYQQNIARSINNKLWITEAEAFLDHVCIMLFCIFGIPVGPPVSCKLSTTFYDSVLGKSAKVCMGKSWHLIWKRPLVNIWCWVRCCGKVHCVSRVDRTTAQEMDMCRCFLSYSYMYTVFTCSLGMAACKTQWWWVCSSWWAAVFCKGPLRKEMLFRKVLC